MDEVRKVARAYYNGAAGTEKELARKLFRSLDANGDGKVSLREYKKAVVHSSFSNNDFFKELDANCDGNLDFDEVLALYYMDKVSVPRCRACKSLLIDSYFSCLPCQADVSYYLCCDCYGRGNFKHHHSSNKFVDTRAMLKLLDQILKQSQITSNQETDEVHLPQGAEDDEKLADVVTTQGMALEEEEDDNDDDDEEEEEDGAEEEEDDEEEEDGAEEEEEDEEEEEGAEEDEEEEDENEEDGDGDEVDKCDNPNLDVNFMDGKAVKKKSQPQSKKSNRSQKKTKINRKAGGKLSNRRHRTKREKIAKTLEAMNTAVSIGSAVVSVGAIAVATTTCCIM